MKLSLAALWAGFLLLGHTVTSSPLGLQVEGDAIVARRGAAAAPAPNPDQRPVAAVAPAHLYERQVDERDLPGSSNPAKKEKRCYADSWGVQSSELHPFAGRFNERMLPRLQRLVNGAWSYEGSCNNWSNRMKPCKSVCWNAYGPRCSRGTTCGICKDTC